MPAYCTQAWRATVPVSVHCQRSFDCTSEPCRAHPDRFATPAHNTLEAVSRRQVLQAGLTATTLAVPMTAWQGSAAASASSATQHLVPASAWSENALALARQAETLTLAYLPESDWDAQSASTVFSNASYMLGTDAPLAAVAVGTQAVGASGGSAAVQQAYDGYAGTYDRLDSGSAAEAFGIPDLRQELLASAFGRVLEVAVGTGLNLPLYRQSQLTSLTGIDISEGMLAQAQQRVQQLQLANMVALRQGDVEQLPFDDSSFDSLVDTFSLCVFPSPARALKEMARVVRPGGKVLLLEHSRSSFPPLGAYQDATAGVVAAMGKGCVWNQNVLALLSEAGLRPVKLKTALGGLITLVEAQLA